MQETESLTTSQAEKLLNSCIPGATEGLEKQKNEIFLYLIKSAWKQAYRTALDKAVLHLRAEEDHRAADSVKELKI